ncbi:peptidoglycan-associated lipoprotein Pal [Polynucleobacter asymbioticus]|jgi:peptidoglycan-associated lipoprotein|uniref:Peptidoglycan-associated lipoprotein n=1 Tax=Polynucleobacter asymbioticus (strain DSM 18221 / CIP 109841 / QLW-P1DMWA-1) TaxID=312153 RepID=A4SWY8_POLAQ|nr:peptidoglycan-associated lipoprotein Pal [Polynucleobacter asymbioticus]ABP34002.1 OmpA/MotB domain protein [Polynucleobacter asymbioticus QLW-P1DMWA-1]APC05863.1 peptidoglycan-associated lipoprotein [Polynucleobacter asymbioticus]
MKFFKICILAIFAVLVAACSTGVKLDDNNRVATVSAGSPLTYDPISDPRSSVYGKRSIYFEFDSYSIDPKYASIISAHASYLKSFERQKASIIIQGNTDDRGTAEYNLALGQRRSEAVKKALLALGVSESQVEAVSFGKEKPENPAQTEAAFKENRRADIVYR